MNLLLGKLACWLTKHKRGRMYQTADSRGIAWYACPRCGKQWSRKARKVKP